MISRDVIVDALRIQAIGKKQDIAANIFGKLKTVCQMVAIIVIFFLLNGTFQKEHSINYCLLQNLFMYFALITSVLSGIIYFSQYYLGKNK
jgi:CDP-diacylglycerol--glycerol-3-phosphate 3-phosphatidyltransferase